MLPAGTNFDVYLHTTRGPRDALDDRRPVGIGMTIAADGFPLRTFQGWGYADDEEMPRAYAVSWIITSGVLAQGDTLTVHTKGLLDRIQHFQRGNGLKSDGTAFVGWPELSVVSKALKQGLLRIVKLPAAVFIPDSQRARFAAESALREALGNPASRHYVPAILSSNYIVDFREVA
ncbi:hypothetical protein J2Y48_000471 [Mycoplana sp. BE70]|uniref:hypothetical protein n=1 Tax=Mycoplana sp. BE70 TaxID=2817775 RepID=UPI002857F50D|nr:hypothetical protein [Mycoplana sp. BE70]MDR6755198.1 hypothetical protein [Mycoplana sp. BE70]